MKHNTLLGGSDVQTNMDLMEHSFSFSLIRGYSVGFSVVTIVGLRAHSRG
jgi:hypothetical protein